MKLQGVKNVTAEKRQPKRTGKKKENLHRMTNCWTGSCGFGILLNSDKSDRLGSKKKGTEKKRKQKVKQSKEEKKKHRPFFCSTFGGARCNRTSARCQLATKGGRGVR